MTNCPAIKKEKLRGITLNDYEHYKSIVTVVHECQLEKGHEGPHECGCEWKWERTSR